MARCAMGLTERLCVHERVHVFSEVNFSKVNVFSLGVSARVDAAICRVFHPPTGRFRKKVKPLMTISKVRVYAAM
jgi:hypothetical protein